MRDKRVLDYLNEFKMITSFEAFAELGNSRLSASIFNLRKDYEIEDIYVNGKNRDGDKIRWKVYFFSKDKDEVLRRLVKWR